jgi:hypothetical protein
VEREEFLSNFCSFLGFHELKEIEKHGIMVYLTGLMLIYCSYRVTVAPEFAIQKHKD